MTNLDPARVQRWRDAFKYLNSFMLFYGHHAHWTEIRDAAQDTGKLRHH
jgi:hypothetical protein